MFIFVSLEVWVPESLLCQKCVLLFMLEMFPTKKDV